MSLATTASRRQAVRPAKPAARYWKGKAPQGLADVESDSDEEELQDDLEEGDVVLDEEMNVEGEEKDESVVLQGRQATKAKAMNIALKDVSVSKEGKVIVAGRDEVGRTVLEQQFKGGEDESEEEESEEGGSDEEESSEEGSESEEGQPKAQFRPVFVPKRSRVTIAEREQFAEDTEEALKKREEEAERRKKESHNLVAESIKRELAEKEKDDDVPDVDDTDGLDPEGEFEAWRLRELARIKKEKEAELEREKEREEIERRRALPEDQRLKEDMERAERLREEKPKGSQKFLQKYWHKGAFHQDMEILKRHDFTEATESTVDVSLLPQVMQVKNFGKRSRTKYTHLLDQDTTAGNGGFGGNGATAPNLQSTQAERTTDPLAIGHHTPEMTLTQGGHGERVGTTIVLATEEETEIGSTIGGMEGVTTQTVATVLREAIQAGIGMMTDGMLVDSDLAHAHRTGHIDLKRRTDVGNVITIDGLILGRENAMAGYAHKLRTVKVAIIGSGLAGLTAGYLLTHPVKAKDGKEDVQIESPTLGMDSASVSIPGAREGEDWRIDVPMRSFQGGYYPNVIALYKKLGVSFRTANFSYSFSFMSQPMAAEQRRVTTTAIYEGASGRKGVSKPAILRGEPYNKDQNYVLYLFGKAWGTSLFLFLTVQLVVCFAITLWHSIPFWRPKKVYTMTLGEWVMEVAPTGGFAKWARMDVAWGDYVETILLPLMSAMTTTSEDDVLNHPVEEILDYCWLTLGTNHYVVNNGVREVVSQLSKNLANIHLGSPITSIRPDPQHSHLISMECSSGEAFDGFHHLIFATQASSAVPLLGSYMNNLPPNAETQQTAVMDQIRCLRSFKYRSTIVINHTDNTLLPDDVQDRRDLNLITSGWPEEEEGQEPGLCVSSSHTMATHVIPRPAGYPPHFPDVYQTTNPFVSPRKDTIISVSSLERAVLDCEAKEALEGLCQIKSRWWWGCRTAAKCGLGSAQGGGKRNGDGPGIWFSGSYAYLGVPLLEGCVVSARNVVEEGILKTEGLKLCREPWNV